MRLLAKGLFIVLLLIFQTAHGESTQKADTVLVVKSETRRLGVDPGGDIMIHGQANGWEWASPLVQLFPWTYGCIG